VKKIISAMLAAAVVLSPLAAQAGQLNNRINNQEKRIYNGVKNGSLTSKEYKRLDNRVDNIEAARYRAIRSGGKLTNAEKYHLNRRLDRTSKAIYRAKHN
jgi:peptidoglycan hydrolase CwlO-like protein